MGELLAAVGAAIVCRYFIVEPAMKYSGAMDWLEKVRPKTPAGAWKAIGAMFGFLVLYFLALYYLLPK